MSTTITIKAKGLYLSSSDFGAPDGALAQADNVVISRDGIVETRRGFEAKATKSLTRLFPYADALVGHDGTSTLSRSADSAVTWTDYGIAVTPPSGYPVRAAQSAQNLFLTDQVRPKRIDSLTGTPEEAGVPGGLDVELALSSAGSPTAVPTDAQVAYRILFGKRDANQRLILGAPSSRGVVSNSSGAVRDVTVGFSLPSGLDSSHFVQGYRTQASASATTDPGDEMGLVFESAVPQAKTISSLVRLTNVVTATTTTAHGYSVGQIVRVSPGGSNGGLVVAVGDSAAATSADGITWTDRTIPAGTYRAVAWNGTVFAAVGASVAATSPDGITWTSRTIPAGTYRAVTWNGSIFCAVGESVAATSPDGTTWTTRTIPAGTYKSVAWSGTSFVAVGPAAASGAATSPDGTTWTSRATPTAFNGVAWTGSLFAAVGGASNAGTSPDGITWTSRTITGGVFQAVAWSGSVLAAVSFGFSGAYSSDGVTWTAATMAVNNCQAVAWMGDKFIAVVGINGQTSADGITWTSRTMPNHTWYGVTAGGAMFSAGEKTITTVPLTTTFTYAETGSDGTLTQTQTATPLTGVFLDTVPDGFLGASLYTNENQEGILRANDRPPLAREMAQFNGSLFLGNVTLPATGTFYLLGTGGSNGLANDDTITINGVAYTAKAAESISAKQFKRWVSTDYTPASVSNAIRDTAASLLRVVNRSLSSGATITDISDPSGVPGYLEVRNSSPSGALTVAFSRTTAFSPTSISESPKTYQNGLVWSKDAQPDHFPREQTLLPVKVGADDKELLRLIPTRSALFALKEDGIFRITGLAGSFSIDPFDPTIKIVAPETAVALDNSIYALADQGVVRISDTGVALVSYQPGQADIQSALLPLIANAATALSTYAYADAYESASEYRLALPASSGSTSATQAYRYNVQQRAWTRDTLATRHAVVNPADNRRYFVDGTSAWQERKTLDDTDLADRSYAVTISSGGGTTTVVLADATNAAVGDALAQGAVYAVITAKASNTLTLDRTAALTNAAATVYKAISTTVKWTPRFGSSPALLSRLQEVVLFWDSVYFAQATLGFASNISPAETTLPLLGSYYAWTGSAVSMASVRAWPPTEKAWGSQFSISFAHSQAWSPNAISGLAVTTASRSRVVSTK